MYQCEFHGLDILIIQDTITNIAGTIVKGVCDFPEHVLQLPMNL